MYDKKTVIKAFDNLRRFADTDVHPIVSPDNWNVYSKLRDLIDQAEADVLALLKEQSEIVLCKDCKYGEHMCKPWSDIICNQNRATHIPDWFCADGKRKEI